MRCSKCQSVQNLIRCYHHQSAIVWDIKYPDKEDVEIFREGAGLCS